MFTPKLTKNEEWSSLLVAKYNKALGLLKNISDIHQLINTLEAIHDNDVEIYNNFLTDLASKTTLPFIPDKIFIQYFSPKNKFVENEFLHNLNKRDRLLANLNLKLKNAQKELKELNNEREVLKNKLDKLNTKELATERKKWMEEINRERKKIFTSAGDASMKPQLSAGSPPSVSSPKEGKAPLILEPFHPKKSFGHS